MLHGQPPDLVLLDIILPDVDGWEVLKHKNQDDMIRDIPVIIISAQDPAVQVVTTDSMVTSIAQGIPVSKLLRSALDFSNLLLNPNPLDEVGG
jgi:CheY-like chemotaxis protein